MTNRDWAITPNPDLFGGPTVDDVSLEDQIAEVERELAMRRHVYQQRIEAGAMREGLAGDQMLRLEAVLVTLKRFGEVVELMKCTDVKGIEQLEARLKDDGR